MKYSGKKAKDIAEKHGLSPNAMEIEMFFYEVQDEAKRILESS